MLSQCPHCKRPIVVQDPGIHDCPRCHARIWIYPPDSDKQDRVLISPEVLLGNKKTREIIEEKEAQRAEELGIHSETEREAEPEPEAGSLSAPWEERQRRGVAAALKETWKQATLTPTRFFSSLDTTGPLKGVLSYGWIFLTIGYIFWALYRILFLPMLIEASQKAGGIDASQVNEAELQRITYLILIASPLLSIITIYLNALMYHLVLTLMDSAKAGFRGTFRVVIYALSPMLFMAIPIFGDFIAFVWNMVMSIIGLSRVHHISNSRAMLSVFLPPIAFYLILLTLARVLKDIDISGLVF